MNILGDLDYLANRANFVGFMMSRGGTSNKVNIIL